MDSVKIRLRAFSKLAGSLVTSLVVVAVFASAAQAHVNDPCRITITPEEATNVLPADNSHTVTVTVTKKGDAYNNQNQNQTPCDSQNGPVNGPEGNPNSNGGFVVHFVVVSGPNAGKTGDVPLGADGKASFSWTGGVVGTDTIEASITYVYTDQIDIEGPLPENCVIKQNEPPVEEVVVENEDHLTILCTEKLTVSAVKHWITDPPVEILGRPDLKVLLPKSCQSKKFKVRPSISDTSLVKQTKLYVDNQLVKRLNAGPYVFTINTAKYSSGKKHKVRVVAILNNGAQAVTATGTFKACAARVTLRRIGPRFTG